MLALASPVAGRSDIVIQCADIPYAGLAYPSETPPRIVISSGDCDYIQKIVWHQRFPTGSRPLRVLLHEAVHIRQGPTGPWDEHEAECGSLAALGPALHSLGYFPDYINTAVSFEWEMIREEPAPYGGTCLQPSEWPAVSTRPFSRRARIRARRTSGFVPSGSGDGQALARNDRCVRTAGT
jgi:hypothetical protein